MFANDARIFADRCRAWTPIRAILKKWCIRGNSRPIRENPRPGFRVLSNKQHPARKDQM